MNVDLEVVKKQYLLCKQLIQSMGATSNKIMNTYMNAGSNWHDEHYVKLGSILQECSDSLLKTILHISANLEGLDNVVAALQEYDEVNFGGGTGYGTGSSGSSSTGITASVGSPSSNNTGNSVAAVMSAGEVWANGLSDSERSALRDYTGNAYLNINSSLRGQTEFNSGNAERACMIHNALSNASIPQNCIVYRGTSPAALGSYQNLSDEELVGCQIAEAGFMSTSLNQGNQFMGAVQLEISVPAGAHGAYVGHLSQYGHNESEVLFDAGQILEITGVRRDFFGNRTICARMIT